MSKVWHGPYVEAVCGTDGVKREAIIAEAERAIVDRLLELIVSAVETDEILELQSAAYAITKLKKASPVVYASGRPCQSVVIRFTTTYKTAGIAIIRRSRSRHSQLGWSVG